MSKNKSQSQNREEEKKEESKDHSSASDKKKRSESAKPPGFSSQGDKLGHTDIKILDKRVTNDGKAFTKVAEILDAIVKVQEKAIKTEQKITNNIEDFSYFTDSNTDYNSIRIFEESKKAIIKIYEKKSQTTKTHEKLTINGIGYLPTNMTAKYKFIK